VNRRDYTCGVYRSRM